MRCFLDFEASSLSAYSHPIEVGWIREDGTGEAHLIAPAEHWTDWSVASESVHGISRDLLAREGRPASDVATRVLELFRTADAVYSDASGFDQAWLNELLVAAGRRAPFPVLQPIEDLWRETLASWQAGKRERAALVEDVSNAERARNRVRHRALADAEAMLWMWRELQTRVRLLCGDVGD